MQITIYQVNSERDKNRVMFFGYDETKKLQKSDKIDSSIYDKVYSKDVNCYSLEGVYRMFNIDHPKDFHGRSLSVSDIVELTNPETGEHEFHFCDHYGYERVDFEPEKTQEAQFTTPETRMIKVVLLVPGELARVAEIDSSLEGMQKVVGGDIEACYPFDEMCCIIVNEEGKINGLPLNRALYDGNKMIDIIAGTAFICDCSGSDFCSLSDSQLQRYTELFRKPENFIRVNGTIIANPYEPTKSRDEAR